MKHALASLTVLLLVGCSQTEVMQVGPNRYRVTADNQWSASGAESYAINAANAHCASRGLIADTSVVSSRPYSLYSYGGASIEFACVRPQ